MPPPPPRHEWQLFNFTVSPSEIQLEILRIGFCSNNRAESGDKTPNGGHPEMIKCYIIAPMGTIWKTLDVRSDVPISEIDMGVGGDVHLDNVSEV